MQVLQSYNSNLDNPYYFTGRQLDQETALFYFRARYYDAKLGQFISRDPIGYVDGMSLYRGYFTMNWVDALGFKDITITIVLPKVNDPSPESGVTRNSTLINAGNLLQSEALEGGSTGSTEASVVNPTRTSETGFDIQNKINEELKKNEAKKGDNITLNIVSHGTGPNDGNGDGLPDDDRDGNGRPDGDNKEGVYKPDAGDAGVTVSVTDNRNPLVLGEEKLPWFDNATTFRGKPVTYYGILPPLFFDQYSVNINLYGCFTYYTACPPGVGKDDKVSGSIKLLNIQEDGNILTPLLKKDCPK